MVAQLYRRGHSSCRRATMPNSTTHAGPPQARRSALRNPTRTASWLVAALILAAAILAVLAFLKTRDGRGPGDVPGSDQRISPGIVRPGSAP